jgi:hypothetical protein
MQILLITYIKNYLKTVSTIFLLLFIISSKLYGSDIQTRPNEQDGPTPITISIYVIDIEAIDNVRQNFTSDFLVIVKWKDERLAGNAQKVDLNDIWWPNTTILNGRNLSLSLPKQAEIDKDGNVMYKQRFYGHLACHFDLRKFPFDKQKLPISIITLGNTPETINITFDYDDSGNVSDFTNSDWEISDGHGSTDIFVTYTSGKSKKAFKLPIANFEFVAKRDVFFYIWKVIVPLLIIVMMSWAVFYIDPSQVSPQIGLGATSILTLIAFLFSLGKILPPIAYLTKIDFFVYSALALVFLAFAEAVTTIKITNEGNIKKARKIDRISRWLFPSVFIVILILFYLF